MSQQHDSYGDLFDHMVPQERKIDTSPEAPASQSEEVKEFTEKLKAGDMTTTAYFISNAILNLLIEKGLLTEREVEKMINDLYEEFKKKRGGGA